MASAATVSADELATRPHLGVQADGVRRFQYNPRVLDVARSIPRGSIVDRRGLALATGDPNTVQQARADYARFGVTVAKDCGDGSSRCYPAGRGVLPPARRRRHARQLERAEHVLRRARRRRHVARVRRPCRHRHHLAVADWQRHARGRQT